MSKARFFLIAFVFFVFGVTVLTRLFFLQVRDAAGYSENNGRTLSLSDEVASRGDIYVQDKEGGRYLVATSRPFLRVYALPNILEKESTRKIIASALSGSLSLSEHVLLETLRKEDDSYQVLKERIPIEQKQELSELVASLPKGVGLEQYYDRFYPYGSFASHVLGFVGFSGDTRKGIYGIEQHYDDVLSPSGGLFAGVGSSFASLFSPGAYTQSLQSHSGDSVLLTLDFNIQQRAEEILTALAQKWNGPRGSVVVMRPQDGAVLAMASYPSFDPNAYSEVKDITSYVNPVVQNVFEPGSIMKPITVAAGIDTGQVTPETTYEDKGFVERGGHVIRNAGLRVFGRQSITDVLRFSINTGAIFVAEKVGQRTFLNYMEQFGFGTKTSIDLPGEVSGDITNLDIPSSIYLATASFGQGISATPIQVITGIASIANGGVLVQPHLAGAFLRGQEQEVLEYHGKRQVISSQSAAKLSAMMGEAVKSGFSTRAQVPGYTIAGKTGTAQVPGSEGGYSEETVHSFVGFGPALNPAFIILIKVEGPEGVRFASESIAPAFSDLASFILRYYQIPPEQTGL